MNDVNDIVIDTTNDAATWCRFTIADERCQWQIRRLKLRFDDDALIWWMMSMILWMIRRITLLPHADSPLLMNDANDRCGAWNWDLMLILWSDEWCQWYCDWYDECRCYLMQIHHCWWTMVLEDTTNKAEIWCWCSDVMNDVNDIVIDTTNDAATWCWFTIADERCQWQIRRIKSDVMNDVNDIVIDTTNDAATSCRFTIADERCQWKMRFMKLRFDADTLIWWMMPMIVWMIWWMLLPMPIHHFWWTMPKTDARMSDAGVWCWRLDLVNDKMNDAATWNADSPLLMNDDNERCDAWSWDFDDDTIIDEWCQWMMNDTMSDADADAPCLMNDDNEWYDGWSWDLMLMLWSDEWF